MSLQRYPLANPLVAVDGIQLVNSFIFLKTWLKNYKLECLFHFKIDFLYIQSEIKLPNNFQSVIGDHSVLSPIVPPPPPHTHTHYCHVYRL